VAEKNEPIIHKMTEALPDTPGDANQIPTERPGDPAGPLTDVDQKQHNAEVQPGREERLVDIGRGQDTKGRGSVRKGSE
jgi:hypothetical protein